MIWFRILNAANVGTIFVGLIPKDLNTAQVAEQRWTARKNELVGIENSNKLPIRGDLMISLNFSIDINPQVFYIFVGLFVIYEVAQVVWLLKLKNKIKLEMFKDD